MPWKADKNKLSGSTDGRAIQITATATPGTVIHTARAVTGLNNWDELFLEAWNDDTVDRVLTIEWGGVGVLNEEKVKLPTQGGPVVVIPGAIIQNALVVRAYAESATLVKVRGYVNEMANV